MNCEHHLQLGVIQINNECILSITCQKCDLIATATGIITDLGGGYTIINPLGVDNG